MARQVVVVKENSFGQWRQATNTIAAQVGELDNLVIIGTPAVDFDSLVEAINTLQANTIVDLRKAQVLAIATN